MTKKFILIAFTEQQRKELFDIAEKIGLPTASLCRNAILNRIREEKLFLKKTEAKLD